jgi:hypothetical protein
VKKDRVPRANTGKVVTFANIVLPVPGGPCIRIFLYIPRFRFVFFVAIAMSLKQDTSLWFSAEQQYVAIAMSLKQDTSLWFSAEQQRVAIAMSLKQDTSIQFNSIYSCSIISIIGQALQAR